MEHVIADPLGTRRVVVTGAGGQLGAALLEEFPGALGLTREQWDVTLPPKKTITSVLKKAGTVEYYCRFHPNMKATLIVAP